jgi:hypothetical protein
METEKVNMGEMAPDKDFLDRVGEIADELRDMVQKDRENRFVLLLAGDGNLTTRLIQGPAVRLKNISGRSLAEDEDGREVMLGIIISWLSSIDTHTALNITKVLHETTKQISKEEVSRPKAEA